MMLRGFKQDDDAISYDSSRGCDLPFALLVCPGRLCAGYIFTGNFLSACRLFAGGSHVGCAEG
jgi:hypothetical protein